MQQLSRINLLLETESEPSSFNCFACWSNFPAGVGPVTYKDLLAYRHADLRPGCQPITGMDSESFEEALTDLEMVVDIGFKLDSDNFLDFEEFYYRKLNLVLETDRNSLYHDLNSKQTLRYLQRLTAIQAKLREYMSKHTAERMNTLVTTCLYATINASDQAVNIPVIALALGVEVSLIQAGRPQ